MIAFHVDQSLVPPAHRFSAERLSVLSRAFLERFPEVVADVEVTFVTDEEIRRYNRQYRGKDAVTDVLSFGGGAVKETGQLGDILISFAQAERQAEDGDITLELADLLVHGTLHLLGYDHEVPADAEIMFPLQDTLVAALL
jgi:probable rRNA maturation factor